jgi:hypothetical protein
MHTVHTTHTKNNRVLTPVPAAHTRCLQSSDALSHRHTKQHAHKTGHTCVCSTNPLLVSASEAPTPAGMNSQEYPMCDASWKPACDRDV